MILSRRRLRSVLSTVFTALVLAMLAALAALGISLFLDSFSRHENTRYEPKDMSREIQLQREPPAEGAGKDH